jgi:hypothetical protein
MNLQHARAMPKYPESIRIRGEVSNGRLIRTCAGDSVT